MVKVNEALQILQSLDMALEQVETNIMPIVDEWLKYEVIAGNISELAAREEFHYDSHDEDAMAFTCHPFTETWQYGGREEHCGETVSIPYAFIEDMDGYAKKAEEEKKAKILAQKLKVKKGKQAEIHQLEAQIKRLNETIE